MSSNNETNITDQTFDKLDVNKISVNFSITSPESGIIDTNKLNATTEIETNTLYCKSLVVTDSLYIPVENMPNITKKAIGIDRIGGPKTIYVNEKMGKLSYDGKLKDLSSTSNTGEKRSVTDSFSTITNNARFKDNIILKGWSPADKTDTILYQMNGKFIDLEEHVYYQGCGYAIAFNNPYETSGNILSDAFSPVAFMSRIDYFVVTIDSFSNIDSFPVNFLDISLYNSIGADLRMNVTKQNSQYKLEVMVNSTKEVKWFVLLNLKKIYLSPAVDIQNNDGIKYPTSDNLIDWQPVIRGTHPSTGQLFYDICFKFTEGLQFVNISPFSNKVVNNTTTYADSVIDNSITVRPKQLGYKIAGDDSSVCEIVNGEFMDITSSAFDYNTYGYHSSLLIQPTSANTKRMTTTYAHTLYMMNNNNNIEIATFENEFGNSFTKPLTKDAFDFSTSYINTDPADFYWDVYQTTKKYNKTIKHVFQLKETEEEYRSTIGIVYYRLFSAKAYTDSEQSYAHKNSIFEIENTHDITDTVSITLQLYKYIGNILTNETKQIYLTQNDNDDVRYFDLGTHHFIKSYINIRDITNNKNVFCTHYASIILPTYTAMRQFVAKLVVEGGDDGTGITNKEEIKTEFIKKYINSNTIINETDINSYEEDETSNTYYQSSPMTYVNIGSKNYIGESNENIELLKCNIQITTTPEMPSKIIDSVLTNKIGGNYTAEDAYESFDIRFPIQVKCTLANASKYQVYILLENNKFKLDTY